MRTIYQKSQCVSIWRSDTTAVRSTLKQYTGFCNTCQQRLQCALRFYCTKLTTVLQTSSEYTYLLQISASYRRSSHHIIQGNTEVPKLIPRSHLFLSVPDSILANILVFFDAAGATSAGNEPAPWSTVFLRSQAEQPLSWSKIFQTFTEPRDSFT
jgi:hypothetical protein